MDYWCPLIPFITSSLVYCLMRGGGLLATVLLQNSYALPAFHQLSNNWVARQMARLSNRLHTDRPSLPSIGLFRCLSTRDYIPPTVAIPAPLFSKMYMDTIMMPVSGQFRYVVQGRCSLSHYPEFRCNSRANGISERPHFGVRQGLFKPPMVIRRNGAKVPT